MATTTTIRSANTRTSTATAVGAASSAREGALAFVAGSPAVAGVNAVGRECHHPYHRRCYG